MDNKENKKSKIPH